MRKSEEEFSKTIGVIIRDLRRSNPKKYIMFCDENGIADSTLQNVETGIRSPKLFTICRIVKALGLSFEEFGKLMDEELRKDFSFIED